MRWMLKCIVFGLAALVLVAVVGIGLAVTLINPNDYKPRLQSLVLQSTGRTLDLQGDLSFSLFPRISLEAGPAELHHEAAFGPGSFVRVEKMYASLALAPLLTGKVDVKEITLSGLKINLVINKAGNANWEAQAKPQRGGVTATPLSSDPKSDAERKTQTPLPTIGSLRLDNTQVSYTDMRNGEEWSLGLPLVSLDNVTPGEKTVLEALARYERLATKQIINLSLQASFMLPTSLNRDTNFILAGKLDQTEFSGKGVFALHPESNPRVDLRGECHLGNLNLDTYLDTKPTQGKNAASTPQTTESAGRNPQDEAETARSLQKLALDLSLTADTITVARLPLRAFEVNVKADKGRISIPVTFTLAGGSASVTTDIDARETRVASQVKGQLRNVQTMQIVQALSGAPSLSGNLNLNWDITGRGTSWPVMSRSLAGKAALNLTLGRIPAFQVIPEGIPGLPATLMDILIERLSASWTIAKGIARSNDLVMQGRALSATGGGTCNLAEQSLDYRVNIALPALPVVPALITGSLASPQYSVDSIAFLRGTAKGLLENPNKSGHGLEKAVEGIFGKKRR